jgi:predicted nucleic acid-binding protein
MIFVDSNIIIDLVEPAGKWREWSEAALLERDDPLVTNAVVLAETAGQFAEAEAQLSFLAALQIELLDLSPEAAFQAGRAHAAYRRAGGRRDAILADFLIGAHAVALDATLLTRDRGRFATYFPTLKVRTCEQEHD